MPPTYFWLKPDDHLCSMSFAKAKKLTSPTSIKSKVSAKFSGYSMSKKRRTFEGMKQGCSESVTKWHDRVKEIAVLCNFGDNLEQKIKDRFIKGMKAGFIREKVQSYPHSMEKLLDFATELETTFNKGAFGSDFESTSEDDDSDADVDFEKDESNYREVHAYDCPCLHCDIIRYNIYDPANSQPEKIVRVPAWL